MPADPTYPFITRPGSWPPAIVTLTNASVTSSFAAVDYRTIQEHHGVWRLPARNVAEKTILADVLCVVWSDKWDVTAVMVHLVLMPFMNEAA